MRIKFKHSLIYWMYWWMIATILIGIADRFLGMAFTRRLDKLARIGLLGLVVVQFFLMRIRLQKDNMYLLVFVLFELLISAARGVLVIPDMLTDILTWPMLYLIFQSYTREKSLSEEFIQASATGVVLIIASSFLLIYKHRAGDGNLGGVIFYAYYSVTFMPLLLYLVTKKIWHHVFFLATIFLMVISTKRAGTLVAAFGYLVYIVADIRSNPKIRNKKIIYGCILVMLFLAGVLFLALDQIMSFEIVGRLMELTTDGGSGRISIWKDIFDHFEEAGTVRQWFGHGYQAVYYQLQPYGFSRLAHNSFVEFLYDYGYSGLFLFLCFFAVIIGKTIRAFREKSPHSAALLVAMSVCLMFGFTSYFFEESKIIMPIAIFWGCVDGEMQRMGRISYGENSNE